jgi:S-adenosylmethionine:tRNA ribosyltransferase-isomerase
MKLSDFDFNLPHELIAQTPSNRRDHSNLLIASPANKLITTSFFNIIDYLQQGDLIVFNNSRVLKSKLILTKVDRKIDFYLNKRLSEDCWLGFAKPSKKLKEGDEFNFASHKIIVTKKLGMGETELQFNLNEISVFEFLDQYGQMPLPPYIKRAQQDLQDDQRYQTVYNSEPGSVAAPTAGLHFTNELLTKIEKKGVGIEFVTLHVGSGTFLPVKTDDIEQHKMHAEYCHIKSQTAININKAKKEGRRIIAVGTTSLRVLESAMENGELKSKEFATEIFIKPGFKFQVVDMLLTNFHLPKTTLFILVCAFAGYKEMLEVYRYAIDKNMRFFSYGDATLLYLKSG